MMKPTRWPGLPLRARAMSTALVLDADGRRQGGRWKRDSVPGDNRNSSVSAAWEQALRQSGIVLDHAPDLAEQVVNGALALDAAYRHDRPACAAAPPGRGRDHRCVT